MDPEPRATTRPSGADRRGRAGPRRLRRTTAWFGVRVGLALALTAPLAAGQFKYTDRALASALRPDEDAAAELAELLLEIEDRSDLDCRRARYLAELTFGLRLEPEAGTELVLEALGGFGPREQATVLYDTADLAQRQVSIGRLAEAERIAAFGLEHVDLTAAWMFEPRLWHVRAQIARAEGRSTDADRHLARMEAAIRADDAPELDAGEGLERQNHMYRARLGGARAQNLLDLGLLDRCAESVALAEQEARKALDGEVLAELRLLAIDRALMADSHKRAIELAQDADLAAPGSPWAPLFLHVEGVAHAALARLARTSDGEDAAKHAADARRCLRAALESEDFAPGERLKAVLSLADLAVTFGELEEAEEQLAAARALIAGTTGDIAQEVLLAVHAWRLARAEEKSGEELERRARELRTAFESLLEQWRRTPRREGGIGFLQLGWRQLVVSEVLDMELALAGEEAALARLLEVQALGTAARASAAPVPTIAQLRDELLAPGRGILVLLPARDRSHLFVLEARYGSDGAPAEIVLDHHVLASRDQLVDLARGLLPQDATQPVGVEALQRRLSQELLPDAARARIDAWREAVVVGFDLVVNLPFGVLVDGRGEPYSERLALCSAPSLQSALEHVGTREAPPAAAQDLVLIACPEPSAARDLLRFAFGAREEALLTRPFTRSRSLVGPAATRTRVLAERELLAGAHVVHFFAHGIDEEEREFRAALVLSPEQGGTDLLRAEDVRALELHGLVILSACGSGRGPQRLGDDRLVHLGGAFLDAGARCVVLSRHPVSARATLELMARLHTHLAAGASTAEALRKARAEGDPSDALRAATFEILGSAFEPVYATGIR